MEDANGFDFSQFKRWYSQAGTPELEVKTSYNREKSEFRLVIKQSCPETPSQEKQEKKKPFFMPVVVALLSRESGKTIIEDSLTVKKEEEEFVFSSIEEPVACSFLRNFSAPVKVNMTRDEDELAFLMAHDGDPFNRWDAGQQLALKGIMDGITGWNSGSSFKVSPVFHEAFALLLADKQADPAFLALALTIPAENWISQQMDVVDPEAVFRIRQSFRVQLGCERGSEMLELYHQLASDRPYCYSAMDAGRRSLRNCLLKYLLSVSENDTGGGNFVEIGLGEKQYHEADNMTDKTAALIAVVNADREAGDILLADFYKSGKDDPLVVDKWLSVQAACTLSGTIERVKSLTAHPSFSIDNPNKIRSLIGAFCSANHWQFHATSGEGYVFLTDHIITLDSLNPQIAARLLTPLTLWRRYDKSRREMMRAQLIRIRDQKKKTLSADVGEIVNRSLG
jgi:aminopeptidase N